MSYTLSLSLTGLQLAGGMKTIRESIDARMGVTHGLGASARWQKQSFYLFESLYVQVTDRLSETGFLLLAKDWLIIDSLT